MNTIDLNSDVGESFGPWPMGDDAAIVSSVSSANVACGFHAGDPQGMANTCRTAATAGVTVGAHVSYRDLVGFGRRFLDVAPNELADEVLYQIGALDALARAAGTEVKYVKPHGALYHAMVSHREHAQAVVSAVRSVDRNLPLMVLPGAVAGDFARDAGMPVVYEAFADRGYTPGGRLVPRREAGALLHDPGEVADRMVRLVREGRITAVDGTDIRLADGIGGIGGTGEAGGIGSICVHSDTPGAVAMASAVRSGLLDAGVTIEAFG